MATAKGKGSSTGCVAPMTDKEALERVASLLTTSVLNKWAAGSMSNDEFEDFKADVQQGLRAIARELQELEVPEAVPGVVEECTALPEALHGEPELCYGVPEEESRPPEAVLTEEAVHGVKESLPTTGSTAAKEADSLVEDLLSKYGITA